MAHLNELRSYAIEQLSTLSVKLNLPMSGAAPHIVNLTLPDIKSETMLHALSARGIYVSNGSACSSHSKAHSSSLLAFGLTPEQADCSIRISFGKQNTKEQIDVLVSALSEEIARLVRIHR